MKLENISDLLLEQYVLNELPESKKKEIDNICMQFSEVKKKLEEIRKSDADILEKYPADKISAGIIRAHKECIINNKNKVLLSKLKTVHKKRSVMYYSRFIIPSLGIAAAAVFFVMRPALNTHNYNAADSGYMGADRVKGSMSSLYVYRKNNSSFDDLHSGSVAKSGDLIQIAYMSVKDRYGIILSIDGRGSVTLHYPAEKNYSTALSTGKKVLLRNSFKLDDAPDFERFFLITSESKLNMNDVNDVLNTAKTISGDRKKVMDENLKLYKVLSVPVNQASVSIIKGK